MNPSPNQPPARCSRCGKPLVESRLDGVCPACLWTDIFSEPADGGSADTSGANPAPPAGLVPIPGHEVREEIARGGMGIVYRARQLEPPRTVALKMLLPHQSGSEQMRERFRLEAQAIAALDHPAILPVYQVGEQDGLPWFTMKLAGGGSLAARRGEFAGRWREIAELLATLAGALQFAHERGVLHRDLKPGNVLFDEAGRAFISDFGLAKVIGTDSDLTRSADFVGTPHYAAPEVAAGSARHATTASDIYSLGAILYELLAGRPPFEAEGVPALLKKIVEEEPALPSEARRSRREEAQTSNPRTQRAAPEMDQSLLTSAPTKLPLDLQVICLKCLAKEPARRYATARELAEDLRRWLAGRPILARPATQWERFRSWARRNPALATVSALLIVALLGGGLALWERNRKLEKALADARRAQAEAQENLRHSLLTQSRAVRQSGRLGQRKEALDAVTAAVRIRPGLDARNEAAAALAVVDLESVRSVPRFYANSASTVDFTPDLSRYVTGDTNGFQLRRAEDGQVLRAFSSPDGSAGHQPRFSSDGNWFFAIYASGAAAVWAVDADRPAWRRPPRANQRAVGAVQPGGDTLAFASSDHAIFLRSLATGVERRLAPSAGEVTSLVFSPDGQRLAVTRGEVLEVFDPALGRLLFRQTNASASAEPEWSGDSAKLAYAAGDANDIVVIRAADGSRANMLHANGLTVRRLAFHPGGRLLASVGADRRLRLWDLASGVELLQASAAPRVMRFSRDGHRLAFAPGHLDCALSEFVSSQVWHALAGEPGTGARVASPRVAAAGRWIATVDTHEARLWDATAGRQAAAFPLEGGDSGAGTFLTADGREWIFGSRAGGFARSELARGEFSRPGDSAASAPKALDGLRKVTVWDLGPGGRQWVLERVAEKQAVLWPEGRPDQERTFTSIERLNGACCSPDGRWICLSTGPAPGASVWDANTGRKSADLRFRRHADARFSPDGRWLLTGTDAEYRLWSVGDWQSRRAWPAEQAGRSTGMVAFSPDGRFVALAQGANVVQLRDTRDYDEIVRLELPTALATGALGWSPDSARLYVHLPGHQLFYWALTDLRQELAKLGLDWE